MCIYIYIYKYIYIYTHMCVEREGEIVFATLKLPYSNADRDKITSCLLLIRTLQLRITDSMIHSPQLSF